MTNPALHKIAGVFAVSLLFAGPSFAQDAAPPVAPPAGATAQPSAKPADGAAASSTAAEPSQFSAAVETLSPLVQDVQVLGPWSDGDARGVWRTVMVHPAGDNAKAHFFIQQLDASGHDGFGMRSSTEIPEIAGLDGQVVGYRADDPNEEQPNSISLFFEVVPTDGEISETYELHFMPGQPYMFGPASN